MTRPEWVVLALGLTALLAGCTTTGPGPTPSAVTVTATPPPSSSPAAPASTTAPSSSTMPPASSATPSSAPTPVRVDPDAPKGQCADSVLHVDIRETGGGLGNRQDLIVFANTGSTTCVLAGAPGVSVVGGGNGTQLGQAAGRVSGSSKPFELKSGGTVTAELNRIFIDGKTTTFNSNGGQVACGVQRGDGYRIYPPHSFRAVFLRRADVWACTSKVVWMQISPVVAGK